MSNTVQSLLKTIENQEKELRRLAKVIERKDHEIAKGKQVLIEMRDRNKMFVTCLKAAAQNTALTERLLNLSEQNYATMKN